MAASICSARVTVPAPAMISGQASFIRRIAVSAPAARNVTSATGTPPAQRAFASDAASRSGLLSLMTGTTPILLMVCINSFIAKTPYE